MNKFLCLIFFAFVFCNTQAQVDKVSFQLKHILFKDLADTIEKTIPVKIYYSDKWVDTLYLNINSVNDSINSLFDKSIARNGFSFVITDDNKVILSKGYTIKTNFRKEYLQYLERNQTKPDTANYTRLVQKSEET